MNIVKKLFRRLLKSQMGFTLIETSAVIAITATIAAVVTPIALDKIGDAKVQAAKQDCGQIKDAIITFYSKTGIYPTMNAAGSQTAMVVLRSGNFAQNVPGSLGATKDPSANSKIGWTAASSVDLLQNHLVYDNPGNSDTSLTQSVNKKYSAGKITWSKTLDSMDRQDPWGHNYVVYVKALNFQAATDILGTKEFGWAISAGPNALIDTSVTDPTIQGDDVGVIVGAKENVVYAGN